jgi:hypothetical protein
VPYLLRGAASYLLGLPISLLRFSSDLSRGTFDLGLRIAQEVTCRALHFSSRLLDGAANLVLVHNLHLPPYSIAPFWS